MDGFYVAYLTGHAGNSVLMFVIRSGVMVGVDIGRMKYDGNVTVENDIARFSVTYIIPPGANLITGAAPPTEPTKIPFQFTLPANFANGAVQSLLTPLGPVNARIEKLRDI